MRVVWSTTTRRSLGVAGSSATVHFSALGGALDTPLALPLWTAAAGPPRTVVSIVGDEFHLNGQPTCAGRVWQGHKIQGLLLNARLVQGIFDDRNAATVARWAYPDTGRWDAERNTREFITAMPDWRRHGLLATLLRRHRRLLTRPRRSSRST
jgi:hypothetical protein